MGAHLVKITPAELQRIHQVAHDYAAAFELEAPDQVRRLYHAAGMALVGKLAFHRVTQLPFDWSPDATFTLADGRAADVYTASQPYLICTFDHELPDVLIGVLRRKGEATARVIGHLTRELFNACSYERHFGHGPRRVVPHDKLLPLEILLQPELF